MPIVDPGGLAALDLFPLQINARYHNAQAPGHQGETRDQRIAKYLQLHPYTPVLGLPEGNWIEVRDGDCQLRGPTPSMLFRHGNPPSVLSDGPLVLG